MRGLHFGGLRIVSAQVIILLTLCSGLAARQSDALLAELRPRGYVSDFAGVFGPEELRDLEALLQELDARAGAQIAVVTLPSMQGGEIRDFSNRLFERWGIGHEDDRGLLVLTALEERRIWVEVGYGLEPLLPDGRVGRALDDHVIPRYRSGDIPGGLVEGCRYFASIIARDAGVELSGSFDYESRPSTGERPLTCLETVVFLILAVGAVILFIRHPWLLLIFLSSGGGRGSSGGFGGGGFGGFGGGASGGGGAGRSW